MVDNSIPPRILVIDDDPMSRELLTALLEAAAYNVACAESCEAAIQLIPAVKPAVILTDLHMPGAVGVHLARDLRQVCDPSTILLAMSASEPDSNVLAAFDGFLLKPFPIARIADAIAVRRTHPSSEAMPPPAQNSSSDRTPDAAFKPDPETQPHRPSPADNESLTPILNETIYGQLASRMPTPQLHELYTLCVNDARERIALMRTLIPANESTCFVREAHSIKGSSGMLGATQLHGIAAELEQRGLHTTAAGHVRDVNSLDELSAACDRLERMLGSRA